MNARFHMLDARRAVLALLLALALQTVDAQQYAVPWFRIAGGGGMQSSGGVYALSGTIGQPDAGGALTNGPYSLTGGFWPGAIHLVQSPGAPWLAAEPLPGGSVRLFWRLPAADYLLDQTSALVSPPTAISWSPAAFPYQTNGTHIFVIVPGSSASMFYRLRQP